MNPEIAAWQRWLPPMGTLTSAITALCCLGVAAVVSVFTAIGATFMTTDTYLRPILAVTLVLTGIGSALTFMRHRQPIPLLLTVASGIWVFLTLYAADLFGHSEPASGNGHGETDSGGGHSGDNLLTWGGLAVLVAVQIWDLWLVRRRRRTR